MQAPDGVARSHPFKLGTVSRQTGVPLKRRRESAAAEQVYDRKTGQVYIESTTRARTKTSPWYHESLGSPRLVKRSNVYGAGSLRDVALRLLLTQLDCLELNSFQALDWTLGQVVLEAVRKSDLLSFSTWCVFMARYFEERPGNYRGRVSDNHYELDTVIHDLTDFSLRVPFLTFLTVNDTGISAQTYTRLGDLPNLAVLKLWETGRSDNPAGFNERIFRNWQAASADGVAFGSLRAIELTDLGISSRTILDCFRHCHRLSLVRILPRDAGRNEQHLHESWQRFRGGRKSYPDKHILLNGQIIKHAALLAEALRASELGPSSAPHCTIKYGRNEDTRYYRERPMNAEVWVREPGHSERRVATADAASDHPTRSSQLRAGKAVSLKEMLGTFHNQ